MNIMFIVVMANGLLGKEAKGINQQIIIKIFPN
jgi:hypothetical protein